MDDKQTEILDYRQYLSAIASLAVVRVRYRMFAGEARQTLLSILGVGLAISLMLVVTSVGLGLAAQGTMQAEHTDFWIVPDSGASSPVTQVQGPALGRTHSVTAKLQGREDVTYASPILLDIVRLETQQETSERVFLVGIIPGANDRSILGLNTGGLDPGDPYYGGGSYNGTWTGQAVISLSGADALNASVGSTLVPEGTSQENRSFVVSEIQRANAPGIGQLPVVMIHLAEAQTVTGNTANDRASRILVDATHPGVKSDLEEIYPRTRVVSQRGLLAQELRTSDLPLAMSLTAVIVAVVIGLLTIFTTVGFEFVSDAETRAVLAAMGIRSRTRILLLGTETLVVTTIGGIAGIVVWLVSVGIINLIGHEFVAVPLTVVRPELVLYGLAVAIGIGLLSLPYLLALSRNRSVLEALPSR